MHVDLHKQNKQQVSVCLTGPAAHRVIMHFFGVRQDSVIGQMGNRIWIFTIWFPEKP